MMLRAALRLASPPGAGGRLAIVIFHRVLPAPDPLFPGEVDAAQFARLCGWFKRWFQVLPLDQATERLKQGSLPARALAITFDDGYADNHEVALPILLEHGLPACFFVASGFLDGGRMWNDTVIEAVRHARVARLDLDGWLPDRANGASTLALDSWDDKRVAVQQLIDRLKYCELAQREHWAAELLQRSRATPSAALMMSTAQMRGLRGAGMQIGGHTVRHPILASLDRAEARREMLQGREALQAALGEEISLFAYPNGKPHTDFKAESVELARELGFAAAFTTAWGAADGASDPYQLPRFSPWDRDPLRWGLRMLGNYRRRPARV